MKIYFSLPILIFLIEPAFAETIEKSDKLKIVSSNKKLDSPSGIEIIKKSDEVRNPHQPFRLENHLIEYHSGVKKHELSLVVFSKEDGNTGQFKNVVVYVEPKRDAGKVVQFSGTTMWFYDPASKASVKIPPQQRIVGQASEGDVVTVNFSFDYNAKLVRGENLDDADRVSRSAWHLELTPRTESAVYNKIEYWTDQKTYQPIKAKFFSDSGRLLKIAYYHKYEMQMGKERPTEVIIIDGLNPKYITTMNFSNMRPSEIPDSWFQRESMSMIKAD